jgi:hypothetical protein
VADELEEADLVADRAHLASDCVALVAVAVPAAEVDDRDRREHVTSVDGDLTTDLFVY